MFKTAHSPLTLVTGWVIESQATASVPGRIESISGKLAGLTMKDNHEERDGAQTVVSARRAPFRNGSAAKPVPVLLAHICRETSEHVKDHAVGGQCRPTGVA